MKHKGEFNEATTLVISLLLMMSNPAVGFAEELAVTDNPSEDIVSDVEASTLKAQGHPRRCAGWEWRT